MKNSMKKPQCFKYYHCGDRYEAFLEMSKRATFLVALSFLYQEGDRLEDARVIKRHSAVNRIVWRKYL